MTRTARIVFLGATAVAATSSIGVGESRAATPLNDPLADGNVACIGKEPSDGKTYIIWQKGGSPIHTCFPTLIGDSYGLFDDYHVNGLVGWDHLKIGCSIQCGGQGAPFKTMTPDFAWGGHYIDLAGNDGNDWLRNDVSSGGIPLDTWFFGDAGNDLLVAVSPIGRLIAHDGNDALESKSPAATFEWLDGGAGDDCLRSSGNAWDTALYDCGPGNDKYTNWVPVTTNCETLLWGGTCPTP
jgi:hypothetical protein